MKLRYKITGGFLVLVAIAVVSLAFVLSYSADCGQAPAVSDDADLMQAVVYRCYGSPDVIELASVAKPTPDDDEVLVKIHAASVNPLDWHYMRGEPYIMRLGSGIGTPEQNRLGVDFAGTVEAVGKDVSRFKPGDAVFGGTTGAFGEYVTLSESRGVAHMPAEISFAQAASVPIAALTALQALRDKGQLQPGQKVLINGASGGVGTFAVQIAKSLGAEVTGVCSTRNVEMVRSLGADHVVDYTKENYTDSDQRYDLIVDMVGNHSLSANRRVMVSNGRLVIVGGAKGKWLGPVMRPIKAMLLSPFADQEFVMLLARIRKEDLAFVAELMRAGEIVPVIDRHYPLHELAAAIAYSEEGHARGKIIIDVN